MSSLVFLLIVVVISALGSLVLWLQHRKPSSVEHGIDEFSREMRALSPEARAAREARAAARRPPPGRRDGAPQRREPGAG